MPHVFDVYGTLLDVDAAAREAAAAPGMDALASSWPQLAAAWRQRQLSYSWLRTTMQRYTDFWTITQNALDVTMAEMGIEDAAIRETLLSLYTTLSAYDEVPAVLRDLAAALSKLARHRRAHGEAVGERAVQAVAVGGDLVHAEA